MNGLQAERMETGILRQVLQTLRGPNRWLIYGTLPVMVLCLALAVYCGVQFATVADTQAMLKWGAGLLLGMLAVLGMKIWYWMELNRNAVSQQLHRLEDRMEEVSRMLQARAD